MHSQHSIVFVQFSSFSVYDDLKWMLETEAHAAHLKKLYRKRNVLFSVGPTVFACSYL
jgi:hypothetical protein